MVLAKLALYKDSISSRQAVRLTLIKGARAKHMNPIDLTTLKERLHERLTLPEAESVLLQRMTSSRLGKPEKELKRELSIE